MLTSFFGKSKPVNFLVSGLYIFFGAIVYFIFSSKETLDGPLILGSIGTLGACIFSILLLDFIIRKNGLTLSNNYAIIVFASLLLMFPQVFWQLNLVSANVLILLALRRIFSLASAKNTKVKILDASLWIALASLFYFWSLLVFVVLYVAILKNKNTRYRYLLIPPIGFAVIYTLAVTFIWVRDDSLLWFEQWKPTFDFDFATYNTIGLLIPTTILLAQLIWTGFSRLGRLATVPKKDRANYKLVHYCLYVTLALSLLAVNKDGSELIFVFTPAAIIITNYLESLGENWFREVLLWVNLSLPILLYLV